MTNPAQRTQKKYWLIAISILVVLTLAYFIFNHFYTYESDAYLEAYVINITPDVSGHIVNLYVKDLEKVKKGQILFEIDPRPYQYAFNLATATLANAKQEKETLEQEIVSAKINIEKTQLTMDYWQKQWQRYNNLAEYASQEKAASVYNQFQQAKTNFNNAKQQVIILQSKLGKDNSYDPVKIAEAKLQQAQYNLAHTKVLAPEDGMITADDIHVGDYATEGQPLFGLVDNNLWWVFARVKEADLREFKIGDKVSIWLRMYPGHLFTGEVYGVAWGVNRRQASSGVAHSVLPYLERTENWINLQQRFPVRINLVKPDPNYPLRVGASARIFIHHELSR